MLSLFVFSALASTSFVLAQRVKCSSHDPRTNLYPECMISREKVLWCDYSNYTEVPVHGATMLGIYGEYFQNAVAIYLTDSCIQRISKDRLSQYTDIEVLECGNNQITSLTRGTFQLNLKLTRIYFGDNYIEEIEEGTFEGLSNLKNLNLEKNRLKSIHPRTFGELESLTELSLHNNYLSEIVNGSFGGLKNLESLNLSANQIVSIEENAFSGLNKLRILYLDGNKLKLVKPAMFPPLMNLEVFTVSFNEFEEWPLPIEDFFHLRTLNIANNKVTTLEAAIFAKMPQLRHLHLQSNQLSSLPDGVFIKNLELIHVDLSNNSLEYISKTTFYHLQNFLVLNISNNKLKKFHQQWFRHMPRQEFVKGNDVSGNLWECDDDLQRYMRDISYEWCRVLSAGCSKKQYLGGGKSDRRNATCRENQSSSPRILLKSTHMQRTNSNPTQFTTGLKDQPHKYEPGKIDKQRELPISVGRLSSDGNFARSSLQYSQYFVVFVISRAFSLLFSF